MRVKLLDLHGYSGCTVYVTKEMTKGMTKEDVSEGSYIFLYTDFDDNSLVLLKDGVIIYLIEYDNSTDILITDLDITNRVNNLVDGLAIIILILTNNGWTYQEQQKDELDLTPYINRLKGYIALKNIINPGD